MGNGLNMALLKTFIDRNKYAVLSTVNQRGTPEAALVGIVAAPDLRLFFDTAVTSRKYRNLVRRPEVALVIGWNNEQTLQYEGTAYRPEAEELEEMAAIYDLVFPEGKMRRASQDIACFCIRPHWVRLSDYNIPVAIRELFF